MSSTMRVTEETNNYDDSQLHISLHHAVADSKDVVVVDVLF